MGHPPRNDARDTDAYRSLEDAVWITFYVYPLTLACGCCFV